MTTNDDNLTESHAQIGLLAMGEVGILALTGVLENEILQGLPFNKLAISSAPVKPVNFEISEWLEVEVDSSNQAQMNTEQQARLIAWNQSLDMLFIMVDVNDDVAQGWHADTLDLVSNSNTLIFTIPLSRNTQLSDIQLKPLFNRLLNKKHNLLMNQFDRPFSSGSLVATNQPSDAIEANKTLVLIIYSLIGPLFFPDLIGTDLYDIRLALPADSQTKVISVIQKGQDRAKIASNQILAPVLVSISNDINGVLINITYGSDFSLTEFDEITAILHTAFPEHINYTITMSHSLALLDEIAIFALISQATAGSAQKPKPTTPARTDEFIAKSRYLEIPEYLLRPDSD